MGKRNDGASITDTFSGALTGEYAHRFIGFADSVSFEEAIYQFTVERGLGSFVMHSFIGCGGVVAVIMALRNYCSDSYHPLFAEPTGRAAGIDLFHIPVWIIWSVKSCQIFTHPGQT